MSKNQKRPYRGDKKPNNPLAGLVICKKCGRKMQRRPNTKNPDLLMCSEPTCDNHASYIYLVEKHILQILKNWSQGFNIEGATDTVIIQDTNSMINEAAALRKNLIKLNAQLDKAFDAFETGVYDAQTFKNRSSVIKQRLSETEMKISELEKSIKKAEENERMIREFIPKVKHFTETYGSLTDPHTKNLMLSEIIDHSDYVKNSRGHGHEEEFTITIYPRLPKV